jgi:hypothetical protein
MSLDVYLTRPGTHGDARPVDRIFIRENGATREVTREEWDQRFPGAEPVTVANEDARDEVYSRNITHNLNTMAGEAGIYKHLWRPDEIGVTKARELIEPLRTGLALMRADPERFRKHNPENGWGDYDGLVAFVADYLAACEEHPDADVRVWR